MKQMIVPALAILAAVTFFSTPSLAADLSGWQAGCAYRMPSGSFGSGSAMMPGGLYCTQMATCQKMADQRYPNMMGMGCFAMPPSSRTS